jgi:hypothetical protein
LPEPLEIAWKALRAVVVVAFALSADDATRPLGFLLLGLLTILVSWFWHLCSVRQPFLQVAAGLALVALVVYTLARILYQFLLDAHRRAMDLSEPHPPACLHPVLLPRWDRLETWEGTISSLGTLAMPATSNLILKGAWP